MAAKPTLEAIALLGEFGFEFVATDQVGEPTPGRIADRLSEIIAALEDAAARGNMGAVHNATEKLKRLQQAIDVWSLLASDLDDAQAPPQAPAPRAPAPVPPPPVAAPPPPVAASPMAPPPAPPPVPAAVAVAPPPPAPVPVPAPVAPAPQVAPPPAAAAQAVPAPEYPAPAIEEGPIDVERLELAAAGTQQAFLQAIGQVPPKQDKK
jgi:hypothetical protein